MLFVIIIILRVILCLKIIFLKSPVVFSVTETLRKVSNLYLQKQQKNWYLNRMSDTSMSVIRVILTVWFFHLWKNLRNFIRRLNIPLSLPICRQKLWIKNMGTFPFTLTVWNMFPSVLLFLTEMTGWLSIPILLYAISDIILAVHISLWKNQKEKIS